MYIYYILVAVLRQIELPKKAIQFQKFEYRNSNVDNIEMIILDFKEVW